MASYKHKQLVVIIADKISFERNSRAMWPSAMWETPCWCYSCPNDLPEPASQTLKCFLLGHLDEWPVTMWPCPARSSLKTRNLLLCWGKHFFLLLFLRKIWSSFSYKLKILIPKNYWCVLNSDTSTFFLPSHQLFAPLLERWMRSCSHS